MKRMTLILLLTGTLCFAAAFACSCINYQRSQALRWTVVCNGAGQYSFIDWQREVSERVFGTYKEAMEAALANKQWSEDYDHPDLKAYDARRKAAAERAKRFKPCE